MEFAGAFPKATEAEWRDAVARVLKGADFARVLVGRTADGVEIQPLRPRRADAAPVAPARGAARWKIGARFSDPDAARGNALLHEDLLGGVDLVTLTLAGSANARGFGLRDAALGTLDHALAGVHLDLVALRLESQPFGGRALAEGFAAHARRQRLPGATLDVEFGLQPLADCASTGHFPLPFDGLMDNARDIIRHLQRDGFKGPFLRADGRPFHEAGASEAQELACVIAQGAGYLRALVRRGISADDARGMIAFTLAADDDQFLTIAKCRALRLLWARIEEVSGLAPHPLRLHVETAWRMMTRHDPYVNLLRTTIAAFAAGIGGADSIEVLPFTAALGLADGAARRLARNTSLILIEESNLHRVVDPASGAGSIEALTDALCEKAWDLFRRIEREGEGGEAGMIAALRNGFLAEAIRDTRDGRARQIATRKAPITGVSEFPNITETPVDLLASRREGAPAAAAPFPSTRLAEPYETLRERAEKGTPRVFLANLGRVADFTARTTFARNAFEAGGIMAFANDGFWEGEGTDLVAMTDAFKASGARLACLCSSDAIYAEEAEGAAMALIASGATGIWLAGRPGEAEMRYRAAGVTGFVFAGCDMLAFLDTALNLSEA